MTGRIALLTMFDVTNYGSVLQTFASQDVLERLGYGCDIINYKYPNEWHFSKGYYRQKLYKRIISKAIGFVGYKTSGSRFAQTIGKFRTSRLNLTPTRFESLSSLENYDWSQYDVVISGSDQVWNPRFMKGDKAFLLSFVPDNVKKISMASSFACRELERPYKDSYSRYLSRLSSISVRDNNGVDIIRSLGIDIPVKVMLDPTLLLSGEEWKEALGIGEPSGNGYILVYILNYAFNPAPYIYEAAKEMQRRTGKKIVFIGIVQNEYLEGMTDYEISNWVPVEDFVTMFANADIVITSSFHGTAFAVNFSKPLVAVTPSNGDDRQTSLLKNLGIGACAVNPEIPVADLNPFYDTGLLNEKLSAIRKENISWLADALK